MYNIADRPYPYRGKGGGVYLKGDENVMIDNLVAFNEADSEGGGIYCQGGTLTRNIICYNKVGRVETSYRDGGGIYVGYCYSADPTWIDNCLIYRNQADGNGGGIYAFPSTELILQNLTLTGNTSTLGNGLFADEDAVVSLENSILWNNNLDEISYVNNSPTVTFCNVWGGWPGTGNINADPMFVNAPNDDYHIYYASPCRDAGESTGGYGNVDFEGDPRMSHGALDMGCDEFYTHLYYIGNPTPGAKIAAKLIGLPCSAPTGLFIGSGVQKPPLPTQWGDFFLQYPLITIPLPPIPGSGVMVLVEQVPGNPPPPYDIPLQALIGNELTNLCLIQVK